MNSVGSFTPDTREIDGNVLNRSMGRVTIDDAGAKSVGDFAIESWEETMLLGEYLTSHDAGSTVNNDDGDADVSFFKSVGVGWLDIIAGGVVVSNDDDNNNTK